jgi:hypothetical protein
MSIRDDEKQWLKRSSSKEEVLTHPAVLVLINVMILLTMSLLVCSTRTTLLRVLPFLTYIW